MSTDALADASPVIEKLRGMSASLVRVPISVYPLTLADTCGSANKLEATPDNCNFMDFPFNIRVSRVTVLALGFCVYSCIRALNAMRSIPLVAPFLRQ